MKVVLFDNSQRHWLFPFTKTKPVSALFFGMYTNLKRWELYTGHSTFALTEAYLQSAWALPSPDEEVVLVDASLLPDRELAQAILQLNTGEVLLHHGRILAGKPTHFDPQQPVGSALFSTSKNYSNPFAQMLYPWHIFLYNRDLILSDVAISQDLPALAPTASNKINGKHDILLGENVQMEHCIINTVAGPVIIGHNAQILEGSVLYGPCVIGHDTVVKAGTRLYSGSIGDFCTVGGEIKNTVIMHYSNKAHDGYLGDSVIGEWCNLGAGTSNSNVRNDAADIIIHIDAKPVNAGLKCGLLMGDYCRSAINTSFNTATIAGVASSIFGAGLTPKNLSDFTWGYSDRYIFGKAVQHIRNWKQLKQQGLTEAELLVLEYLYKNA